MGIETETDNEETNKNIMSISSDQLYVNEISDNKKKDETKAISSNDEAAAITVAKLAAKTFVKKHPES